MPRSASTSRHKGGGLAQCCDDRNIVSGGATQGAGKLHDVKASRRAHGRVALLSGHIATSSNEDTSELMHKRIVALSNPYTRSAATAMSVRPAPE